MIYGCENIMSYNQEYYFILKNFYNSILSLDKYVKEFVKSKDIFHLMKNNNSTDEGKIEFIYAYLNFKNDKSEENQELIEKIEKRIQDDYKLRAFLKHVRLTDKSMTSEHPYIKTLIHNCNIENENIKNEVTQLKNNQIKNLISIFEGLISNLLVCYYKHSNDPNLLNKENIDYKDLEYIEKIEDIKDFVIDKKVMNIMYNNFNNWLKKYCDTCIKSGHKSIFRDYEDNISIINELFERRHLLTHNNGKINHIYLSKTDTRLNENMNIGDELIISNDYLDKAILTILEFGTILYIKSINIKDIEDKFSYFMSINNLGLDFVKNGYYKTSQHIFEFLFNNSNEEENDSNDVYRYNIWLSKLLRGKSECLNEIEDFFDKKECSIDDKFARSILLKEDNYKINIEEYLKDATYSQIIQVLSWPIFLLLENDKEYIELKNEYLYNDFEEGMIQMMPKNELENVEIKDTMKIRD